MMFVCGIVGVVVLCAFVGYVSRFNERDRDESRRHEAREMYMEALHSGALERAMASLRYAEWRELERIRVLSDEIRRLNGPVGR